MLPRSFRRAVGPALLAVLALSLGTPNANASNSFDVAAENAQPGSTAWRITKQQFDQRTQAYTDRTSALPGEAVDLFVSCTTPSFRVRAFRMGYYGGDGAREVWSSANLPCEQQTAQTRVAATNTVAADWQPSLTLDTTDWPEGMYLLRVGGRSSATFVDLVLRSASTAGRVVFSTATLTFQAYNQWGGANAYRGKGGYHGRARVVSFDRPQTWGLGSGKFLGYEFPLLQRAEALGLPLAYVTDVDIATIPNLLKGATSYLSGGHNEYWTQRERDAVRTARRRGTNLLFFGANVAYWRVRISDSALGANRTMAIYKSRVEDPVTEEPTIRFRDSGQPDAQLTGLTYTCFPASGDFIVRDASSFVFEGTGVSNGDVFAGIVGTEIDKLASPASNVTVLAESHATCGRIKTHTDFILMRDPSGAATVSTGSMAWVAHALKGEGPASSVKLVRAMTDNLLRASTTKGLG